jgi:hypothetical protein
MSKTDSGCRGWATINKVSTLKGITRIMAEVTVVYWRDIPAQVIVGKGRRGSKVQLSERFEQAIDRCAMKVGARDADAYLAEWRKGEAYSVEGDAADVASSEAARLETVFSAGVIRDLIANDGWSTPRT